MEIDKEKLIDLLVEKTSSDREEIEEQLDQLIERILDAANRGKALEIKEFGDFYFDPEGQLQFDPADELSTEISFKYAGMKPVEVQPGRDTSISDVEEDETESEGLEEDFEYDAPIFMDEDEKYSYEDPFDPEEPEPVETEPKAKELKTVSRKPFREKRDHTGVYILLGIVLLAALIGGYFYYTDIQNQDNEGTEFAENQMQSGVEQGRTALDEQPPETETVEGTEPVQEDDQNSVEQESSDEVSGQEINPNQVVSISNGQYAYGLMGSMVKLPDASYSIVLHSFTSEDKALSAAERFREDGYRVTVNSRTVYENQVWRVSVGQFETLPDAQQATTQLPDPYNSQNFIQRLQTN